MNELTLWIIFFLLSIIFWSIYDINKQRFRKQQLKEYEEIIANGPDCKRRTSKSKTLRR